MKIAVIGAGIVGALIARELTKYDVETILIEKEMDVGWGVTKANSAIVHAGYDDPPGSVRAQFCAIGNKMYTELSEELDFELKRIGSLVVAFDDDEIKILEKLLKQGEKNGVPDLMMLDRNETLDKEPKLNPSVKASLWAPTAGITEPWMVAIAAVENALDNGLKLYLDEKVVDIVVERSRVKKVVTEKGEYDVDIIVNCAGLFADEIAKMAGA
ncbi:MAG TPA: FAD-dependent oxidoreductase, partial [Thermotoga sp.]|nr:FAD-dependent oxidoreductase [Thermotoga sp.]